MSRDTFGYDHIKDAPIRHVAIARYIAAGVTEELICDRLGYRPEYLQKIVSHPVVSEYIQDLKILIQAGVMEQTIAMSEMRQKVIAALSEAVQDPDIKPAQLVSIAKLVFDHHPDKAFIKTTKQQVEHELGYDNSAIEQLKERARALGVEPKKYIEHVINDDAVDVEFTPVTQQGSEDENAQA